MSTYRSHLIILPFMPLFSTCSNEKDEDKVKKVLTNARYSSGYS